MKGCETCAACGTTLKHSQFFGSAPNAMPRCARQLVPQNTLSNRTVRDVMAMQRWTLRQVAWRQLQQHTEADRGVEADIRGNQLGCRTRGDGRAKRPAVYARKRRIDGSIVSVSSNTCGLAREGGRQPIE